MDYKPAFGVQGGVKYAMRFTQYMQMNVGAKYRYVKFTAEDNDLPTARPFLEYFKELDASGVEVEVSIIKWFRGKS